MAQNDVAITYRLYPDLGGDGFRALGVAWREEPADRAHVAVSDEQDFVFAGFAVFLDPPKDSAGRAIADLEQDGIAIKILTPDLATQAFSRRRFIREARAAAATVFGGMMPGGTTYQYTLTVSIGAPPLNDNCANATVVGLGTVAGTTISATTAFYGVLTGQNTISGSNLYTQNAVTTTNVSATGALYGTLAGANTVSGTTISGSAGLYGALTGQNTISGSNLYVQNSVTTANLYGNLIGQNLITASNLYVQNSMVTTNLYGAHLGQNLGTVTGPGHRSVLDVHVVLHLGVLDRLALDLQAPSVG